MIIYCNLKVNIVVEDFNKLDIHNEHLIYSNNGIYKKYKKHFYLLDINKDIYCYDKRADFFIQSKENSINKNKILTSIPYNHYFVERKKIYYPLNKNITFVKEIDNDIFVSHYFITSYVNDEILDEICLFLNNKL